MLRKGQNLGILKTGKHKKQEEKVMKKNQRKKRGKRMVRKIGGKSLRMIEVFQRRDIMAQVFQSKEDEDKGIPLLQEDMKGYI